MLGGLDTPTKGSVTLAGKDLYRMKEDALAVFRRRKIGFVFQAFNLVSSVNVWENIVLPLGLDGRKVDEAYECFLLGIHTVRKVCGGYQPATAGF